MRFSGLSFSIGPPAGPFISLTEEKVIFKNQPIAYDYHGEIPFNIPFSKIESKDIHIYLDLDTNTGRNACES